MRSVCRVHTFRALLRAVCFRNQQLGFHLSVLLLMLQETSQVLHAFSIVINLLVIESGKL